MSLLVMFKKFHEGLLLTPLLCLPDTYLHVKVNLYQAEGKIHELLEKGTEGRSLKPLPHTPWTDKLLCRPCMPLQQQTLPAAPEPSKTSGYLSRSTTGCQ